MRGKQFYVPSWAPYNFVACFPHISEDIFSGLICTDAGTCVNRTENFMWCECEKGCTNSKNVTIRVIELKLIMRNSTCHPTSHRYSIKSNWQSNIHICVVVPM